MKLTKRIFCLLLVCAMFVGMLPATAFATDTKEYVYLSISFDGQYIDDKNGAPIIYLPIPLETIAAVDLTAYGLDNMLFDADGNGEYETTALQLLIYAHEELYGGEWGDVNFDALPGSSYFAGGIFGFTENLVYFHNGDFPVDESQQSDFMTIGATSDRIVLKAGDFLDVASFSCYSFLWDTLGGFHFFADSEETFHHDFTAKAGQPLSFKLMHSFCDLMFGQSYLYGKSDYEVFYGKTYGQADGTVTTDGDGFGEITLETPGTYYLWCNGGSGSEDVHSSCDYYRDTGMPCIVSAPGYAKVTVTGAAVPEETVPKETVPEETVPEETVPEETVPEETTPTTPSPENPGPNETRQPQSVSAVLNATMAKQANTVTAPSFGTNAGEWTVFGLARGGYFAKGDKYFTDYYARIVETVNTEAAKVNLNGALHKSKSTENSRLIVALSAIGKDATAVGNWNLVEAYSANGINWIKKQGMNGTIWALIALDSGNYKTSDPTIRQQCVDSIVSLQHDDGGWSLIPTKTQPSNVDITGMTLTALYPYRNQPAVAAACEKAIAWLASSQLENGGFPYGEGETSESCVWAIVALTTWGINPDTDPRFVKNNTSAIDNLLSYYIAEEAMFAHQGTTVSNAMATDQACYALVAYHRFINNKTALYDYSDVTFDGKLENTTKTENAYSGKLDTPAGELTDKLLTKEEQALVASGVDVRIDLTVKDIGSTVSAADKALIQEALNKNTVGLYLDITLSKQLGDAAPAKITETNGAVTITIVLPENLRNTDEKVVRTYQVIRVHDGKTDILDASYDAATGKLSFQTDAFSTYALVYADAAVTAPTNPKTGDRSPVALLAITMTVSVTCFAAVLLIHKKKTAK